MMVCYSIELSVHFQLNLQIQKDPGKGLTRSYSEYRERRVGE